MLEAVQTDIYAHYAKDLLSIHEWNRDSRHEGANTACIGVGIGVGDACPFFLKSTFVPIGSHGTVVENFLFGNSVTGYVSRLINRKPTYFVTNHPFANVIRVSPIHDVWCECHTDTENVWTCFYL
ncbi:hypothetical protein D3C85_1483210 [compost metagenome]